MNKTQPGPLCPHVCPTQCAKMRRCGCPASTPMKGCAPQWASGSFCSCFSQIKQGDMDANNDKADELALHQVDVWAGLVSTAIALAMAVIVYIRRRKLPIPESFRKCIDPLKLTLDFLNGQEYAGGAIEDAVHVNAAQLSQIPGLVLPRPLPIAEGPKRNVKLCGCPIPDITCDCSKVKSCGCPKESASTSTAESAAVPQPKLVGNLPASMLASNRRKFTDTFLTVGDKSQPCGSYRLTPFNPSGPKFRIRRKLGGGFAITSGLDDTGPADGNYTVVTPTETLPGRYVIEMQSNGAYVIQNSDIGPPITKLEEGDYTLTPVHIVPIKTKEKESKESNGTKTSEGDKLPDKETKEGDDTKISQGSKTSGDSKTSKGSQGSKGSKGSKTSEEQKVSEEGKTSEEPKTNGKKNDGSEGSKSSQEVAEILPEGSTEQSRKDDAAVNKSGDDSKPPERKSPDVSEGSFGLTSTFIEKDESHEPAAYFVSHTTLPGMYKLNYCDTRPKMGPRPIPDGIYPLWDRDVSGNAAPSNRSDGVYTLEWVELEIGFDEQNIHLPQPVSERVVSVVSESKPDGSNVTTVTRKTTAMRQVALNAVYPGGKPAGMQPCVLPTKVQSICPCSVPDTNIKLLNATGECICSTPSPPMTAQPSSPGRMPQAETGECTCGSSTQSPDTLQEESRREEHESACPCSNYEGPIQKDNTLRQPRAQELSQTWKTLEADTDACVSCMCSPEEEPTRAESGANRSSGANQSEENACVCSQDTRAGQPTAAQRNIVSGQTWLSLEADTTVGGQVIIDPTMYQNQFASPQGIQQIPPGYFSQVTGMGQETGQFVVTSTPRSSTVQPLTIPPQGWMMPPPQASRGQYVAVAPQQDLPECCRPPTAVPPGCFPAAMPRVQLRNVPPQDPNVCPATLANAGGPGWFQPQMIQAQFKSLAAQQNALPDCCRPQPNPPGYYSQSSTAQNPDKIRQNELLDASAKGGKQVQTIKPKQALQVQPGINIVRRDDNEDVDIVVEMEMEEEAPVDPNVSKVDQPPQPEVQYSCQSSTLYYPDETDEEEILLFEPLPERLSKLEESITVEVWRQGMLAQRITENERVLKHVMSVVANLQNDITNQMNTVSMPIGASPRSVLHHQERARSPQRPGFCPSSGAASRRYSEAENVYHVQRNMQRAQAEADFSVHPTRQQRSASPPPSGTLYSYVYRQMPPR